jgi:hypothetical protein
LAAKKNSVLVSSGAGSFGFCAEAIFMKNKLFSTISGLSMVVAAAAMAVTPMAVMADAGSSSLHRAHKAKAHKKPRQTKRRPALVIKQSPPEVQKEVVEAKPQPAPAPTPQNATNVVPQTPTQTPPVTRAAASLPVAKSGFPTFAVFGGIAAAGGLAAIIASNRNRSSARPASP